MTKAKRKTQKEEPNLNQILFMSFPSRSYSIILFVLLLSKLKYFPFRLLWSFVVVAVVVVASEGHYPDWFCLSNKVGG